MVYKLVARQDSAGGWVAVSKASAEKASTGGRKAAFRRLVDGTATEETVVIADGFEEVETAAQHPDARALQVPLVRGGEIDTSFTGADGVRAARAHHRAARAELPAHALGLSRSDPAIPTVYA
jgi:nicotinate phosphoribosyltransferase